MRYYSRVVKKFKPGEIIFSENSTGDGMYIIDTGRVRVFKTVGPEKREVELCLLGPKSMFGEMAMIDEEKRSASVQAVEPTSCTVITKKIFEDQLNRIPPWMVNLIKILVSRLRDTNEKLRTIVEGYTTAPVDSGRVITVESQAVPASEARKVIEEGKQVCQVAEAQFFKDTRPDLPCCSEQILESLFNKPAATTPEAKSPHA